MTRLRSQATIMLLIGIAIGSMTAQIAYAYTANKQWSGSNAKYGFTSSFPTGAWRDRAADAASTWNNVSTSSWIWSSSTIDQDGDLHYGSIDGAGGTIGGTTTAFCGSFVCSFTTTVDSAESWYSGTGTPSSSQLDLQSNLTHEFGHASWSGHTTVSCSGSSMPTMCSSLAKATTYKRTLEQDDRDGIASVYP